MSSWGTFFCTFSAGYTFAFLLFNSVLCVLQCLKSLIQSNQFPHLLPFHLLFLSTKTFDFIFINQQSLVVFLLEFWNLGPIDSPLTKQPHFYYLKLDHHLQVLPTALGFLLRLCIFLTFVTHCFKVLQYFSVDCILLSSTVHFLNMLC